MILEHEFAYYVTITHGALKLDPTEVENVYLQVNKHQEFNNVMRLPISVMQGRKIVDQLTTIKIIVVIILTGLKHMECLLLVGVTTTHIRLIHDITQENDISNV